MLHVARAVARDASGLAAPHRRHFLPELLASLEEGCLLGGYLDRIAGSGIAPLSGIAAPGPKTPKAPQFHLVPLLQRLANAREKNAHDGFGLPVGKVDLVGNSCSEFCFCHVSRLIEGTGLYGQGRQQSAATGRSGTLTRVVLPAPGPPVTTMTFE